MGAAHGVKAGQSARPLSERFPPSEPCSCDICRAYCARPGWWTIDEARAAMDAGFSRRMMLEMSPELSFGVLSPAFTGCEGKVADRRFAGAGCTFYKNGLCELFGTGYEPLECRFCHHARAGLGPRCHAALEREWKTPAGQALVILWICSMGS